MEIRATDVFDAWLRRLKDQTSKARIALGIRRCEMAGRVVGDVKSVGDGVAELRFTFGPGCRVYFLQHGNTVVLLLVGGDKSTQSRDIDKAKRIAGDLRKDGQWPPA